MIKSVSMIAIAIATPDGEFLACYSEKGLAEMNFPGRSKISARAGNIDSVSKNILHWHRITAAALKAVLAGRAAKKLPPLDLSSGTEFQQSVWSALRNIPVGQTRSYGEIAAQIGKAKAVRAVGGACGANPIPVLVPCHRVLAAEGKLGGFSGGLDWKCLLLGREGSLPDKI